MTRVALVLTACTLLTGWTVCPAEGQDAASANQNKELVGPPAPGVEHALYEENAFVGPPAPGVEHALYEEKELVGPPEPSVKRVQYTAGPAALPPAGRFPVAAAPGAPGNPQTSEGQKLAPVACTCCECGGKGCPKCGGGHFQGERGHLLHRKPKCETACAECKKCDTCAAAACNKCAPASAAGCGACRGCQKSCFQKLCAWLSYCPHTPKDACPSCHQCNACCSGPLYTFFLCEPVPTAHVGDGYYIGQYPSTTDRPIMNAAYGSGFIELPPSALVPQYQRYQ
jgi:hypothetical protein